MKFQGSAKYLTDLIIYLYMDRVVWFFFHKKSTWCTRTSMRFGFVTKIEIQLLNMGASFEIRRWTFYFSSTFQTVSWHILHLYQNSYNWICLFITRLHDISENFLQEHYTNINRTCLVLRIFIHFKINIQNIHLFFFNVVSGGSADDFLFFISSSWNIKHVQLEER